MFVLRAACETDVPGLIGLARRAWHSGFADAAPAAFVREWQARQFEQEWYPKYWPDMTVAEVDGVLLGLVQPMKDEVNGLWVDPAAQGRGVGTALLRHGELAIAAAGFDRAWLTCSGFNPKARRFYVARGYRETGCESKARAGGVVEEIWTYDRVLRPAAG